MDIRSTARERLEAYLDGLSEKQRRGILVAMLVLTCTASGIVLVRTSCRLAPAGGTHGAPFRGRLPHGYPAQAARSPKGTGNRHLPDH